MASTAAAYRNSLASKSAKDRAAFCVSGRRFVSFPMGELLDLASLVVILTALFMVRA